MQHPATTSGPKVLVVEDDAATRFAMKRLLEHHGFIVETAGTVAEALARVSEGCDNVLLDLMLPDGNGGEVLEWLRDNRPTARVTVLTGCHNPAINSLIEALAPNAIIQKPVEFGQILQRLRAG